MELTKNRETIKMSKIDIKKLVTIRHYAEKQGVVRETIMQRIRRGDIPYVVIDGVYFIKIEDNGQK